MDGVSGRVGRGVRGLALLLAIICAMVVATESGQAQETTVPRTAEGAAPSSAAALGQRANALAQEKRWDEAAAAAEAWGAALEREGDGSRAAKAKAGSAFGDASWYALLARQFPKAAELGERGLAMAPGDLRIEAHRAHGLLLAGRRAEALAVYEAHFGKTRPSNWEDLVEEDFDQLRKDGVAHPEMDSIVASITPRPDPPEVAIPLGAPEPMSGEALLGIQFEPTPKELVEAWRLSETPGVRITGVVPGGAGSKAGVLPGDVIVMVGDVPLARQVPFLVIVAGLRPHRVAALTIVRDGRRSTIPITPGARPFRQTDNYLRLRAPDRAIALKAEVARELALRPETRAQAVQLIEEAFWATRERFASAIRSGDADDPLIRAYVANTLVSALAPFVVVERLKPMPSIDVHRLRQMFEFFGDVIFVKELRTQSRLQTANAKALEAVSFILYHSRITLHPARSRQLALVAEHRKLPDQKPGPCRNGPPAACALWRLGDNDEDIVFEAANARRAIDNSLEAADLFEQSPERDEPLLLDSLIRAAALGLKFDLDRQYASVIQPTVSELLARARRSLQRSYDFDQHIRLLEVELDHARQTLDDARSDGLLGEIASLVEKSPSTAAADDDAALTRRWRLLSTAVAHALAGACRDCADPTAAARSKAVAVVDGLIQTLKGTEVNIDHYGALLDILDNPRVFGLEVVRTATEWIDAGFAASSAQDSSPQTPIRAASVEQQADIRIKLLCLSREPMNADRHRCLASLAGLVSKRAAEPSEADLDAIADRVVRDPDDTWSNLAIFANQPALAISIYARAAKAARSLKHDGLEAAFLRHAMRHYEKFRNLRGTTATEPTPPIPAGRAAARLTPFEQSNIAPLVATHTRLAELSWKRGDQAQAATHLDAAERLGRGRADLAWKRGRNEAVTALRGLGPGFRTLAGLRVTAALSAPAGREHALALEALEAMQLVQMTDTSVALQAALRQRFEARPELIAVEARREAVRIAYWDMFHKQKSRMVEEGVFATPAELKELDDLHRKWIETDIEINKLREVHDAFAFEWAKSDRTLAALAPREALLVTHVGEDRTDLALVAGGRAQVWRVNLGRVDLERRIQRIRASLDVSGGVYRPFAAEEAAQLFEDVFAPLAALRGRIDHLVFVPDGPFQALPLGLLLTSRPRAIPTDADKLRGARLSWLVRDFAISTQPSVHNLVFQRSLPASTPAPRALLGIGDPVLSGSNSDARTVTFDQIAARGGKVDAKLLSSLSPLPETARELKGLATALGSGSSTLLTGARASKHALREADASQYRILAFATHGLVSGEAGRDAEPGLVLTPQPGQEEEDGYLSASNIAAMKLNAELVILSACNTASPDGRPRAEGLSGLARAFFQAGARGLLVTHWSIPSQPAEELTVRMAQAKARSQERSWAQALRTATLDIIDRAGPAHYAHPVNWAAFTIVGAARN